MGTERDALQAKLHKALADHATSEKLWGAMTRARENRASTIQELRFDVEEMKRTNRRLKTTTAGDPKVIAKFAEIEEVLGFPLLGGS